MNKVRIYFDDLTVSPNHKEYLEIEIPRVPVPGDQLEFPLIKNQEKGTYGMKCNQFEIQNVNFVYDKDNRFLYTEIEADYINCQMIS